MSLRRRPSIEISEAPSWVGHEAIEPREEVCPYCGESVEITIEPTGVSSEQYVEDCPVCCRPWQVRVTRMDGEASVELARDDD